MRFTLFFLLVQPFLLSGQGLKQIATSINSFGLDACYQLSGTPDHLLSPASISTALGMTYIGSQGQTREQLKKVFYFPDDQVFYRGFAQLTNALNAKTESTTISLANKLWAGIGRIDLNPEFVRKNAEYFHSELEVLSFDDSIRAALTINNWIAEKTADKIQDLLSPKHISGDAILVLTNAIYFKSNWANPFDPELTRPGRFVNDLGQPISVDYMFNKGYYPAVEDDVAHVIELPYAEDEYSFIIILPKISMEELEDQLVIQNYERWTRSLTKKEYELVQVPKFQSSFKLEMKKLLTDLGMPKAFGPAELEGIGSAAGAIRLSAVVHETFIEFNEEGTEAAAATGVVAVARSISIPQQFIADRPFIYLIRHRESNNILFIGKMSNPEYK